MSKWTIEMPDGWKPEDCERCPLSVKQHCGWVVGGIDGCPLSHAVEATANADLVGELEAWCKDRGGCTEHSEGQDFAKNDVLFILSKYTPVPAPKEVKEQGEAGPWPPKDVILKLVHAAEILLTDKDYDGDGHEEIRQAQLAAKTFLPAPVPAHKEVKWCEWAVIRRDWYGARKIGKVLGDTIKCSQEWTPILWDGTEDPDFHKTVGLVFFVTREDAAQYARGCSNADEPCKKCSGKGIIQIAPNTRGMTTCTVCNGKGKIGGNRV